MVKLGSLVRDNINGFEGIATGRVDYLHGCARVIVQPTTLKEDGTPRDDYIFDEQRIDVLNDDDANESTFADWMFREGLTLGSQIKDRITGFEGTLTALSESLYETDKALIEPKTLHEGKPIECIWFPLGRIELIQTGKPVVAATNSARSGGPQRIYASR